MTGYLIILFLSLLRFLLVVAIAVISCHFQFVIYKNAFVLFRCYIFSFFSSSPVLFSNVLSSKLPSAHYFIASTHFLSLPNCCFSLSQRTFLHFTLRISDLYLSVFYSFPFILFSLPERQQIRICSETFKVLKKSKSRIFCKGYGQYCKSLYWYLQLQKFFPQHLTLVTQYCSEIALGEINRTVTLLS